MTFQESTKQRINMAHGFMKSVIRNQIDRDNYDKEIKAKQHQGKHHVKVQSSKQKKPEIQTYVPPQRSKKESPDFLYTLEYEHKNGDKLRLNISKTDIPEDVARKIGMEFDLSSSFIDALTQRIYEEMEKRII